MRLRSLPAVLSLIVSLVLPLAVLSGPVAAAEDPVADAQAVISAQIKALTHDDAAAAYGFASPSIRSLFPDEEQFLAMVRKNYAPVYHLGTYAFGRSRLIGGGEMVLQEVMIGAREGKDWTAIYQMRLMDDGSYKVDGVRMVPNTGSMGI